MTAKKKVFGTDGIRGRVGKDNLTPEFFVKLGWAVGKVLARAGESKALIGKDTRISGYMFESAIEAGLSAAGVDIYLLGPMPTPGIAYLTKSLRAQCGIVISASHNLFEDNGIKFFNAQGTKLDDAIEAEIEKQLNEPLTVVAPHLLGKAMRVDDAEARYIEFCKSQFKNDSDLSGMKIVVDCANGATYKIAPMILRELGANVIDIGVNPDGFNINEHCGSTNPKILQTLVKAEQADIGIALDGDGDRLILVDNKGEVVDGDEILFIIAKRYLESNHLIGGVVGTLMSNMGLELALQDCGVDFIRTAVGDRYVAAELIRTGWILGGESSGHIICRDATTTGDGIVSALKVLLAMRATNKTLHELKSGMTKFPQLMINIPCEHPEMINHSQKMQQAVQQVESELKGRGRVLVRPSGTEPVVRVMVEAQDRNLVNLYAQQLADVVKAENSL